MLRATYTVRNTSRLPKLWLEVHNPSTLPVAAARTGHRARPALASARGSRACR